MNASYYSKRTNASSTDPRLLLLPQDIFKGKRVLDIGCNEGWLTIDVGERSSISWQSVLNLRLTSVLSACEF